MTDQIDILKYQINRQKAHNMELYKSLPVASHEDPRNEKAEPILKQWREGSKKLKELQAELQQMENEKAKELKAISVKSKTFINSYGEAATRTITNTSYERTEKRTQRQIMSFIGG